MVRKKIDNRIRVLIENGVNLGHRTLFVVVGDKGRDQVVILHHMLTKSTVKARPSILWCYKKELGFSSHRKKRMKHLQKKLQSGKLSVNEDDPFELFISSTNIRYCYYSETHKILGNTYGMCVLQDFEALTPNLLARTIETVEGGGIIILLLRTMASLKQLYTMSMDVHQRFRTESHQNVVCRFNERFLLSLTSCNRCLIVNDQLMVLPLSSHNLNIEPIQKSETPSENDIKLLEVKDSLKETQPVGVLVNCCKTIDQAKAVLKFIETISEKTLRSTVSLTASRGRGKSAALGLSVAGAVAFGYANIFVTSPSPENLKTFFEFVFKGFDALEYQEHLDYSLVQSTNPEFNKAIVRINIYRQHRQTIQYIHPSDADKLSHNTAELVVIDEAAAIPLPYVKSLIGPYLVFLASTINGYEGTGRSLSLKLLQQLRNQTAPAAITNSDSKDKKDIAIISAVSGRVLHELTLEESIRYKPGDPVEKWLVNLLCLDASIVPHVALDHPPLDQCDLYYVNRDTLFCYHRQSEAFLQRLVSLYVASHYKNSPNDLQMLSDAPAHHLFCLLGPVNPNKKQLPEILVVIQICLEGEISSASISNGLSQGKRAAGDLIPWTIAQQYQDEEFPQLAGARIVRIATHPDRQGEGYGTRAVELLKQYFENKFPSLDDNDLTNNATEEIESVTDENVDLLEEVIQPKKSLPPLLLKLNERRPEKLNYLGVSFGMTSSLLKFWKRSSFVPVYLRQTTNDLTGEHSCIMMYTLNHDNELNNWLNAFWLDFRKRFISLLVFDQFKKLPTRLALEILSNKATELNKSNLSIDELDFNMSKYDIKRLEMYSNNLVDYHLILDLLPTISRFYFLNKMKDVSLSPLKEAILLGLGLQCKEIEVVALELDVSTSQILAIFNQIIRKCIKFLNETLENAIGETLNNNKSNELGKKVKSMVPVAESLQEELDSAADKLKREQKKQLSKLKKESTILKQLEQFQIKGSDEDWKKILTEKKKNLNSIVTIKSGEKKTNIGENKDNDLLEPPSKKHKPKDKMKKKNFFKNKK